ncbi:MAG: exopolysaccharide Pel transporter PelG [Fervidobacterium sp.]|uniref:exopolysaccharide Pel transporter PelG n=1 Tax=Fervidobacterium sp. TaxID=1871331 RepID=UPI0030974A08
MAGIGFELNKFLKRNSFFSDIFSFFYSANVSAGPWIMSSTTLVIIQLLLPQSQIPFFISGVIYTFIFSTILFGSVSTSITRYLADLIYKKEFRKIYSLYTSSIFYAILSSGIFLTSFFILNKITDWRQILLFSYSLMVLTIIWVQVIFITAIMTFLPVVLSFLFGSLISLLSTFYFFKIGGEYLAYLGYNLGFMFIMSFLQLFIRRYLYIGEEQSTQSFKDKYLLFFDAVKAYKPQAISGFFSYMAAWVDDFIAWAYFKYSVSRGFIFAPQYDIPMFISYLFIIPTLTLFVLNLETVFYTKYRGFYRAIEENRTLNYIRISKDSLDTSVYSTTRLIFSVQFAFALSGIILSKYLADVLSLSNYGLMALRFGIVGAAANGLFLYTSLLSHYFDLPKIPMHASIMAFSINFIISLFTISRFPGIGFAIGFLVAIPYSMLKFRKVYSELLRFEFLRNAPKMTPRKVIIHENIQSDSYR